MNLFRLELKPSLLLLLVAPAAIAKALAAFFDAETR